MRTRYRALLAIGALLTVSSTTAAPKTQRTSPRVIDIVAERFEFWPSEITITEGEEVEFRIQSDDTMHGFRIVGAGVNVAIPKRGKGQVIARFVAPAAGRLTYECSRMCGAGHNFMRGTLVVRPASR